MRCAAGVSGSPGKQLGEGKGRGWPAQLNEWRADCGPLTPRDLMAHDLPAQSSGFVHVICLLLQLRRRLSRVEVPVAAGSVQLVPPFA